MCKSLGCVHARVLFMYVLSCVKLVGRHLDPPVNFAWKVKHNIIDIHNFTYMFVCVILSSSIAKFYSKFKNLISMDYLAVCTKTLLNSVIDTTVSMKFVVMTD